jgi:dimethylargininase
MTIKRIVEMKEPATLDGGDVLYTGRHIFVGQSQRSNAEGIETLRQVFAPIPVVGLPMPKTVLHLKCLISLWHGNRLFIADTPAGRELWASLTAAASVNVFISLSYAQGYEAVWVPDMLTANVLSLPHSKTMLIQNVRNDSVQKLTELARAEGWKAVVMDMSETVKADGALTCLSVLFGQ